VFFSPSGQQRGQGGHAGGGKAGSGSSWSPVGWGRGGARTPGRAVAEPDEAALGGLLESSHPILSLNRWPIRRAKAPSPPTRPGPQRAALHRLAACEDIWCKWSKIGKIHKADQKEDRIAAERLRIHILHTFKCTMKGPSLRREITQARALAPSSGERGLETHAKPPLPKPEALVNKADDNINNQTCMQQNCHQAALPSACRRCSACHVAGPRVSCSFRMTSARAGQSKRTPTTRPGALQDKHAGHMLCRLYAAAAARLCL
jgi:hypothetical protein